MGKRLFYWELGAFAASAALGTLLHFVYEWSGGSPWAAAVSAVNESTWEHMKILYTAIFAVSLVQLGLLGKNYPGLPAVRAVSALTATALIPALYYTYLGIWGKRTLWAGIAVFMMAAAGGFLVDYRLLRRGRLSRPWMQAVGLAVWWGALFLFVWWTFRPPHIPLFRDPVTLEYGIPH